MAVNFWSLPGVRLLCDIIDTVNKQKVTTSDSTTVLFEPPDVFNSIHEHKEKIAPAIRALKDTKIASAETLIDHLEAVSLANFIKTSATSKRAFAELLRDLSRSSTRIEVEYKPACLTEEVGGGYFSNIQNCVCLSSLMKGLPRRRYSLRLINF